MPRLPRLDIAGTPQLVLQRGLPDRPLFRCAADFRQYLDELQTSSRSYGCEVHAYALLPRESRLLLTSHDRGAMPRMMQALGRRFAYYVNERDASSGSCWNGRYRSCPVSGSTHVLLASAYVERSPIRAGIIANPAAYHWSSYACNALGIPNPVVRQPKPYFELSDDSSERRVRYREIQYQLPNSEDILMHVLQGRAWGDARFLRQVARMFGDRGEARPRGRPRKPKPDMGSVSHFFMTLSPFLLTRVVDSVHTLNTVT